MTALVALFAFFLFAAPIANIRVGPVPLYIIDVLALLIIVFGLFLIRDRRILNYPFVPLTAALLFLALVSELVGMSYGASALNSVFMGFRFFVAHGIFLLLPLFLRSMDDVLLVLKYLALALLLGNILMILTSLPFSRGLMESTVFSLSFLEPANQGIESKANFRAELATRGRTLVGVSIIGATYISIMWPLVAFLRLKSESLSAGWRMVTSCALTLTPFGILMSYSRSAIAGAVLTIVASFFLPAGRLRAVLLPSLMISAIAVVTVGVGSSLFFFERLENRFTAALEDPLGDIREYRRFYSYIEPFEHVVDNPQFLVFGEGMALTRTSLSEQRHSNNHSVVGAGYYAHGILWVLLFLSLLYFALKAAFLYAATKPRTAEEHLPQALFLSLMPVIVLAAFAPGLSNNPRVTMMFFFLVSLVVSIPALESKHSKLTPMTDSDAA